MHMQGPESEHAGNGREGLSLHLQPKGCWDMADLQSTLEINREWLGKTGFQNVLAKSTMSCFL